MLQIFHFSARFFWRLDLYVDGFEAYWEEGSSISEGDYDSDRDDGIGIDGDGDNVEYDENVKYDENDENDE